MNARPPDGFTLIELVMIIVVLGIIAAVAIPRFGIFSESARENATREEMRRIKMAIIGDPRAVSGGQYINRGFEGDVGFPPGNLVDLVQKPDSIQPYDKFTRVGWNGPYLDSTNSDFLYDSWGNPYVYNPGVRTITSDSPTPDIVINF
jgi:prepilin-type N-terminal cleavage/methylation domain-containing protein